MLGKLAPPFYGGIGFQLPRTALNFARRSVSGGAAWRTVMDMVWALVLLVLVGALVYSAYALGRASAFAEMRRGGMGQGVSGSDVTQAPGQAPVPSPRANLPRTAAAPPVLVGDEEPTAGPTTPRRSASPPPAAAAGSSSSAGPSASTPRRTAAPPPAAAAWSTPKSGSDKKGS